MSTKKLILFAIFVVLIGIVSNASFAQNNSESEKEWDKCKADYMREIPKYKAIIVEQKAELICKIKNSIVFYRNQKNNLWIWWFSLTVVSIVAGALTPVLIGIGWAKTASTTNTAGVVVENPRKIFTLFVSAIATLAANSLNTFSLKELYELREYGRLKTEEQMLLAKRLPLDELEFLKGRREIEDKMLSIEREQAKTFFSLIKDAKQDNSENKQNQ